MGPVRAPIWLAGICLGLILCISEATDPVEFQPGSIYTFRQPGKAFVEYTPKWSNRQRWGIGFSFRTHKANTMLVQNSFVLDAAKADLWITLQKGQLNVRHIFNEDTLSISCGKGLSHDHWHDAFVEVDLKTGNISCMVNGRDAIFATLKSEVVAQARNVLVDDVAPTHMAITSVGGFSPDSLETPSHFIGCIGNVTFYQDGRPFGVTLNRKESVDLDCVDLCDSDNPCVHGGHCINHYTKTSCDCFSTGFEGSHCNRKGSSAVTLQGSEWITYIIYDSNGKAHSPVNKVALEFKTRATEGVLFFGYSQTQYNHLAISLRNASLHVSVVFVDSKNYDELWLPVGINLNDNKWHRVTVNHHGREVAVTLDNHVEKMTASEGHQHLHMDPAVYFGGTERAHTGKGLRSQRNFVGCLRSLYFNHNSILERTELDRAKFHGTNPQLGCLDMNQRILQFTQQGSFVKVEHAASEGLEVKLQFRTLKADAVLVYSLAHSGGDDGYIQVLLRNGQVEVLVVPSVSRPSIKQSATTGENLNDNQWHTLQLKFEEGTTQIEVDGEQSIASFPWKMKLSKATFLGFGPDSKMKYGFVGCMQEIHVQEAKVRPVEVVHSQLGVGVSLGPCGLSDWCTINGSFCLNGGRCVNIWDKTYCDCSHTQYEGKFCQFSKLLRTCDEYYQLLGEAEHRSGVWTVDVDGSGPLGQSHVYCEMGVIRDGSHFATTWISHNLDGATPVRGPGLEDLKKVVKYREMDINQLQNLVKISGLCQQYLQINCSQSHLRLGELTWLTSASGRNFASIGGQTDKSCECFQHSECLDKQHCNCDAEGAAPTWDGGFLSDMTQVPVTELVFKQELKSAGAANVTMGPLKCLGTRGDDLTSAVTFMQPEVFLKLPSWLGGEIRFDFQTRQPDAVLLYQPEEQTKSTGSSGRPLNRWKDAQLYILLRKGNLLVVMFEGMDLWQTVTSQVALDDGKWQHVVIEILYGQLRVTLNRQHFISDLPKKATGVINKAQPLYVGGKPRTNINDLKGFVGCIRGLTYNGVFHELGPMANKPGISLGCSPACSSDPCANGAVCEEQWSSYSCKCLNPIAQSGKNCEIDINTNAVSFLTSQSFLKISQETTEELIQQEVIFSFRSLQSGSVLLYIHDHLNNFMQLEIPDAITLSITYNSGETIIQKNLTIHGIVDGTWKQVAILPDKDKVVINFDRTEVEVLHPWKMLTEYSVTPFKTQESIVPLREPASKTPAYIVYLGGVANSMSSIKGFVGCLRGLKVAGRVIDLQATSELVDGVQKDCPDGCTSSPCQNHGSCVEGVALNGFYTCNCINTGFAGTYCSKEVGLYFGGLSYITMILRTASPEVMVSKDMTSSPKSRPLGTHDSINFNFATYNSVDQHSRAMVLVQSEHDYIVVYLSSDGRVFAEYLIDGFSVLLESDVHYTTGWPHHVTLAREQGHVSLKVDHSIIQQEVNSSLVMEKPIRIVVGGAIDVEGQLSYLVNFTGDISNVFYTSDWLIGVSGRPLDAYYGLTVDTPDQVTIGGPVHDATQILGGAPGNLGPQVFDSEPQEPSPQMYSFPPWKVGPAQTIKLVETEDGVDSRDFRPGDFAAIAASLTFLILIAVTVVFLLRRASRRHKVSVVPIKIDDEEEGLMGIAFKRKTSSNEAPPPADARSKPRNGRGKKNILASEETLEDFEDEETPMLSLMEESAMSEQPRNNSMEMAPFSNIIDKIPMVDEDSEEEVTTTTEEHTQPVPLSTDSSELNSTDSNSLSGCSIEPDSSNSSSVQLEWDHDGDVSSPLGSVERRKVQQQQKLHQLEDAPSPQQSPKTTEMRESKGRRVSPHPSPSTSNAFGTTVAKPGARSEVWTESQVLDFLDADVPGDDAAAEPAWDPSADALVEMKDEEDDEEEAQLASVHTSCRQGDDNRNNNNATVHLSSLSDNSGVSNDCSVTSVVPNKAPEGQQSLVLSGSPQNYGNDPNVTLISNDNVNSDTNDNAMSLYPSDLSLNQGECHLQGSELNASETTDSETSTELSSDSDASEDGLQMSNPRPQLKLNTAIQPLSPPLGKSPGITQSKGKLKLKAKKNSKSKK